MVDYIRSDQPTMVVTSNATYEAVNLQVVNPTPTGGRPTVITNYIYRRLTGSTGVWTLVGSVGVNGLWIDLFQRSATSIDYFVVTDTLSESPTYTITTPTVTGMWAYAAVDTNTLAHYRYTDGSSESLDEQETLLQLVGRTYPIVEAGVQETQTIGLNVTIPFSETDWTAQVEWWRARKREKRTILYRDGRGRVLPVRILGPLSIAPGRAGSTITCSLQRIDYTASTTTIDSTYYTAGVTNAGGNGVYNNGTAGNGY